MSCWISICCWNSTAAFVQNYVRLVPNGWWNWPMITMVNNYIDYFNGQYCNESSFELINQKKMSLAGTYNEERDLFLNTEKRGKVKTFSSLFFFLTFISDVKAQKKNRSMFVEMCKPFRLFLFTSYFHFPAVFSVFFRFMSSHQSVAVHIMYVCHFK